MHPVIHLLSLPSSNIYLSLSYPESTNLNTTHSTIHPLALSPFVAHNDWTRKLQINWNPDPELVYDYSKRCPKQLSWTQEGGIQKQQTTEFSCIHTYTSDAIESRQQKFSLVLTHSRSESCWNTFVIRVPVRSLFPQKSHSVTLKKELHGQLLHSNPLHSTFVKYLPPRMVVALVEFYKAPREKAPSPIGFSRWLAWIEPHFSPWETKFFVLFSTESSISESRFVIRVDLWLIWFPFLSSLFGINHASIPNNQFFLYLGFQGGVKRGLACYFTENKRTNSLTN